MEVLIESLRKLCQKLLDMVKQLQVSNGAKEHYVIARCIGCGQCESGCPIKVKIKKR